MNDKIMSKATFKEICKIMNGRKTDVWECIKGVFEVVLVVGEIKISYTLV